nr:MAG TPA: hypothetical protein [Caudoviricetes sp.]DAQ45096.1 MAG TPA: hypothetical protein [Caudoviricetes sp.]
MLFALYVEDQYPHVHTLAGHRYALARYPSTCLIFSINTSLALISAVFPNDFTIVYLF